MIEITLTPDEVMIAAQHGLQRRNAKLRGAREDRPQNGRSTWDNEIEGACAELAFCKRRGIYWSGSEGLRAKDGGTVDVRWTKHYDTGGLIVYERDKPGVVVLMDGFAPLYRVVGWIDTTAARRDEWRQTYGYLVPRDCLTTPK